MNTEVGKDEMVLNLIEKYCLLSLKEFEDCEFNY